MSAEQEIDGKSAKTASYWRSRTPEEWRAYHREYYRRNAERRRGQAAKYYRRRRYLDALVACGGVVPERIIRMLFLRDTSAPFPPVKSKT